MKNIFAVVAAFALTGCALFQTITGVSAQDIDTANKALVTASAQLDRMYMLAASLVTSGALSPDQGQQVQDILDPALEALKAAKTSIDENGDPALASDAIASAYAAIALAYSIFTNISPAATLTAEKENLPWSISSPPRLTASSLCSAPLRMTP